MFMRMHGSIVPKMIVPLLFVGAWATAIVLISEKVYNLGVESVLLTITGFVVGLGLSFRSSTAYERYAEGRRYWQMLTNASHHLGRVFWIHASDPEGQDPCELMLKKVTAMNLVVAFSVALKHQLRFEPFTAYSDMQHMIGHLQTFAREATAEQPEKTQPPRKNFFKEVGEYLGLSFATSNPRKMIKKSEKPLGNLPVEILNHLGICIDEMCRNNQLDIPMQQTLAYNNLGFLNDCLTGCERVLSTPLPLAYAIAISQITWVYVLLLPFQLYSLLGWVAIPATIFASYIILGLLLIGGEIENPFGTDVNDLPLELYCEQIAHDMDVIASHEKRSAESFWNSEANMPLYPASTAPVGVWMSRSEDKIREALKNKPKKMFEMRRNKEAGKSVYQAHNMV
jgi:predicted membrane chloride channel (bestrophin family)